MLIKIRDHWILLLCIAAIFSAGGTGATVVNGIRMEVVANTTDRLLRTFEVLEKRVMSDKATRKDILELCSIARRLNIGGPAVRKVC